MEQLPGGYTLALCPGGFPLSTDSMALADFIRLPRNAKVLDLGSGCGTLGLLLCSRDSGCHVSGIELDPKAHAMAVENIRRNELQDRMESICGDLRSVSQSFSPGSISVCISNPPYYSGGPASQKTPAARREDHCSPEELFEAGSRCLKFGGDFFLVHKPERLAHLIAAAAKHRLEAKRLCLLRHRSDSPVSLILLQFRKGAKPGLIWESYTLYDQDGAPTADYRRIYHMEDTPQPDTL